MTDTDEEKKMGEAESARLAAKMLRHSGCEEFSETARGRGSGFRIETSWRMLPDKWVAIDSEALFRALAGDGDVPTGTFEEKMTALGYGCSGELIDGILEVTAKE